MKTCPPAICLWAPERTTCATLVAVGSFTAHAPVSVAKGVIGLAPVQPWQLAHAPSKTALPRGSSCAATRRRGLGGGVRELPWLDRFAAWIELRCHALPG